MNVLVAGQFYFTNREHIFSVLELDLQHVQQNIVVLQHHGASGSGPSTGPQI
jgi:hypothetical protein